MISTIKSEYANLPPLSFHFCCAPSSLLRNDRAVDYYFKSPEVILICFDLSHLLEEDKIIQTTNYILKNVMKHHDFHTRENPDALPPFICHVFTKKDKAQYAVLERNDATVKQMQKHGNIANYLYTSAKTDVGMTELKEAMFNCDIKEQLKMVTSDFDVPNQYASKQKSVISYKPRLSKESKEDSVQNRRESVKRSSPRGSIFASSQSKKKEIENLQN